MWCILSLRQCDKKASHKSTKEEKQHTDNWIVLLHLNFWWHPVNLSTGSVELKVLGAQHATRLPIGIRNVSLVLLSDAEYFNQHGTEPSELNSVTLAASQPNIQSLGVSRKLGECTLRMFRAAGAEVEFHVCNYQTTGGNRSIGAGGERNRWGSERSEQTTYKRVPGGSTLMSLFALF